MRRYTFTPAGDEISRVWQAGYFNDRDRDFHATFDRYLDDMLPAFVDGRPPPVPRRRRVAARSHWPTPSSSRTSTGNACRPCDP